MVPVSQSIAFEAALQERGIPSGIWVAEGKKHLFDLFLKPGTEEWRRCILPAYDFAMKWV